MQEYFAEQVQTEPQFFLEKLKTPGTYPAPEGGFPELEGYNVVSVRLREATITATNDPLVVSQTPVVAASQAVAGGSAAPGYAYAPPPQQPNYAGYGYGAPYVQQPAPPAQIAAKPRKRLFGRDLAIWICVAQLGVIIWWLFGPATEREQTAVKTASAAAPLLAPVQWPMSMFTGFAPEKLKAQISGAKNQVQKKTKSAKKQSGRSGGKMMIPPPPPEMANSKLMVPPPPVAYSLPGPGAVAASTLPPAAKPEAAAIEAPPVVLKKEAVAADAEPAPHVVPTEHAPTASIVPAEEPTAAAAAPAPVPEWLQRVPSYNWQDATNIGQPPVRRVMHNNRQRTITDR
jgi:hypothetical protein